MMLYNVTLENIKTNYRYIACMETLPRIDELIYVYEYQGTDVPINPNVMAKVTNVLHEYHQPKEDHPELKPLRLTIFYKEM